MNSTIMPEQHSLWRFPRIPLWGLFTTALLSVDEPALEFKVTATSKVRTCVHVAGCVASCLYAMLGIILVAVMQRGTPQTLPLMSLSLKSCTSSGYKWRIWQRVCRCGLNVWISHYIVRMASHPFVNIYVSKLTIQTEKLLLYFYSFHGGNWLISLENPRILLHQPL